MNEPYRDHPSEESLERFLLNMSSEEEIEGVETHVLACGYCVEQLEVLETQVAATRLALQKMEAQQRPQRLVAPAISWKNWFTIPRLSFAATAVVTAAGILFLSIPRDVNITAYRGNETTIVSEGRPLHVHLNAAGLDQGTVGVELADSKGSTVWRGTAIIRHDAIDVALPRITESGSHYLRVYSAPQAGAERLLLREFAMTARWTL